MQSNAPNAPLAVWSLILGILSIVLCGPISAIPAIICGHMARSQIKQEPNALTGEGMALAGLIMGYFAIVMTILLFILGLIAAITIPSIIKSIQNATPSPASAIILPFM